MRDTRIGIEALPAALAADRDAAFPHLVRALIDGVYSGALRLTGSRADAEDVTQEAFLRAYRALGDLPAGADPGVAAAAVGVDHRRQPVPQPGPLRGSGTRRRPCPAEAPLADPAPGPEAQALASAGSEALAAHLARLPWAQRSAVVLRHVTGLSYAEVAAALGRPVGTVKADVHRGLQQLRTLLEEER